MRRLWVRLVLAFVGVILVGVVAVAVLADLGTDQAFRQYVARQDQLVQSGLLDDLAVFYQQHGSWDGIAQVLSPTPGAGAGGRGQMRGRPDLILADSRGQIVYDERSARTGGFLTTDERANALPVVLHGQTVGSLVVSGAEDGTLPPTAQSFLERLRTSLLLAALAAGSLGIVLSFLISRALTAPLARLVRAARAFARRDWKHQVKLAGTDEIAEVGQALNDMAQELQRTEMLRRNLVADIAHELRTPLAVMQGNLQAMLDEVYPLDQQEVATLYDQARLLTRLVDDLRELSLADAGQLPLHMQTVEVVPLLQATAAQFVLVAEAQQVAIEVQTKDPLPAVRADPERLAQILRNLLTNALRAMPEGGMLQLSVEAETYMRISVTDTGTGIAAEEMAHIFERFYRVEKSRTHTQNSTGLGLAICQAWVEAMGGNIGVESAPGKGSCFWLTLPLATHEQKP